MFGFLLWLIVGGVLGVLASIVMGRDATHGHILSKVVGIVGAAVGGWILSPVVGAPSITSGRISPVGLLVAFASAIALLGTVNRVTRKR
jgi:uncharacterized membrane protein YeaQ/YmgE (transglycosylase-associated protein family)